MFIDANIFIYAYTDSLEKGKKSRALLDRVARGEQHATTSALVINEVFYFLQEARGIAGVEDAHKHVSSLNALSVLPIDEKTAIASIHYIKDGLQVTDAFHAATMKLAGIGVICSYDRDFDKVKGITRQEPK
ncbi:MAG: type II toxin-antitoxin system VapC family toxin [Candidatus Micrarchaeia archaeon]|jgi:predicted nucleic acid-binding protein